MSSLFNNIEEWIILGLIEAIMDNLTNMLGAINQQVGDVAHNVGMTPVEFNPGVFAMIRTLSETIIIPIAGLILTFIACYELITMIIERNNFHEFETFLIFKWIFKTTVAVLILTNTFNIVIAIFEVAQSVVNQSAGIISGSLELGTGDLSAFRAQLEDMSMWSLIGLFMQTAIVQIAIWAMSICVFIIVFGRMIEIYMVASIAPIPLSTLANREWGTIGQSYLKSLFALGFQGFLIMICIAIYSVMIQSITAGGNIHMAIWFFAGYTALLCFSLFKTGSLAKSLFGTS